LISRPDFHSALFFILLALPSAIVTQTPSSAPLDAFVGEYTVSGQPGNAFSFYVEDGKLTLESERSFPEQLKQLSATVFAFGHGDDNLCLLTRLDAAVAAKGESGEVELEFDLTAAALDEAIAAHGAMPLPPYIAGKRAEDARDFADYQTVYARVSGSVAAPTAGLHFTPDLLAALRAAGIGVEFVTLHVGAGTFLPVKSATLEGHRMHPETGEVTAETAARLNAARAAGGRIVAVGTTSLRLLESAVDAAGAFQPFAGETRIFITPGYRVRAAEALMTNFHLPRSTLYVLVCAFAGQAVMARAYAHAIAAGYRFYSYGDASLLWRA